MKNRCFWGITAALAVLQCAPALAQDEPTAEELQRQIDELQDQLDALADQQEAIDAGAPAPQAPSKNHFGGYGELHYNNLDSGDEIDLHRVVFFFGHDFTDRVRFASELEIEHSFVEGGEGGEVAMEQAYVEFDLANRLKARGGLFLVPIGILNETHEPPTFYGVERNPIETNIVPTTFREAGASLGGPVSDSGFSFDLALHSGMLAETSPPAPGEDDERFLIRDARQAGSEAAANDLAATGRIRYTGLSWLDWAATLQYQSDLTQGADPFVGDASATLFETHVIVHRGPWEARALYARFDIDNALAESIDRDVQDGYYVEASYRPSPRLGYFARFNDWDNGGPAGDTGIRQTNVGLNYWPVENVVLKADVQFQGDAGEDDGFNLGIGYAY
ncbi:MAG: porin [Gammaproteobacteria bacterium]